MSHQILVMRTHCPCSVRLCPDVGEYMLRSNPGLPIEERVFVVTCANHSRLLRRYADLTRARAQDDCEVFLESVAKTLGMSPDVWAAWWKYFRHMLSKGNHGRAVCQVFRSSAYVPPDPKDSTIL